MNWKTENEGFRQSVWPETEKEDGAQHDSHKTEPTVTDMSTRLEIA